MRTQRLDYRSARHLAGRVAAHLVGNCKQPSATVGRILVVTPDETSLGGGGKQGEAWKERGAMTSPNRLKLPGLKPKDLCGIPWRVAFALQADGWFLRSDITLVNWPQNDYWLGDLVTASPAQRPALLRDAKQLSLSFLYWMQTEAGLKGLRVREDIVGTDDGLAKYPYIRESRRIRAEFTVCEQHVGTEARIAETGLPIDRVTAAPFADSVRARS